MALIQATSSLWADSFQRVVISVPIKAFCAASTTYNYRALDFIDRHIKASFAMCVMHRILFGHARFALPFFTAAMGMIGGDHEVMATTRAIKRFQEAESKVLANLAGIQALAVGLLPQGTLTGIALERAAKKSGLVPLSALRRKKVAASQRTFARTPTELRTDMANVIQSALPDFASDWEYSPMGDGGYMPSCAGRCGHSGCTHPIVSESTIKGVLIDGVWSQPEV
jgi:hypothetical protein